MKRILRAFGVACLIAGLFITTSARVRAHPGLDREAYCASLNAAEYWCWYIWLMGCSCTWPDSAGGGGGGAGEGDGGFVPI